MSFRIPLANPGKLYVELMLWSAFLLFVPVLGAPSIHVVGFNCRTGRGRVSSPVVKVHTSGLRVITLSGRLYDLVGAPGEPIQSREVLASWLDTWDAQVLDNVTPTLRGWPGRDDVPAASMSAFVH